MEDKPKPIEVKIIRAEKKGRKITLVFESDLYSDEVFCNNPFYDEGDAKNQLQATHFSLTVSEQSGELKATVEFGNCLTHFTKGHSQMHRNINTMFVRKEDSAINWALTEKVNALTGSSANQVIDMWDKRPDIQQRIRSIIKERLTSARLTKIREAKEKYQQAMKDYEDAIESPAPE